MASLKYSANSSLQTVTLGSAYTSGGGSMTLTSGHGARLPSSGDFWLAYDNGSGTVRLFKVTARSTDTLTVTADATEGNGDGNISSGETLRWALTAAALDQLKADIVASGGLVLLKELTASASASLDFTTRSDGSTVLFGSDFDTYKVQILNVVPATDMTSIRMLISSDNGSTWLSSSYLWRIFRYWNTTSGVTSSASDSSFSVAVAQKNTTGDLSGEMTIYSPATAFRWQFNGQTYDTNYLGIVSSGFHATTGIDCIQFKSSSGNLSSGTIRVYGVKK